MALNSIEEKSKITFGSELPPEVLLTIKLIGKKWSLPILYALHDKIGLGFSELKRELKDCISSNMMSQVLGELQNNNLVEKRIISTSPIRISCTLLMR